MRNYSLLSKEKQYVLFNVLRSVRDVAGCTAELGVYLGGTSRLIAEGLPVRTHVCIDTFQGIPNAKAGLDIYKNGTFAARFEDVQNYLSDLSNIVYIIGTFPQSVFYLDARFAFVHVDGDTHQTTKDALGYFFDRLSCGGIMLMDDWHFANTPGVDQAINEWLKDHEDVAVEQVGCNQLLICHRR